MKTAAALYLTDLLIAYKILLTDFGYWFKAFRIMDAGRLIEVDIGQRPKRTQHKHIITMNFYINKYFNLSRVPKQRHQPKKMKKEKKNAR